MSRLVVSFNFGEFQLDCGRFELLRGRHFLRVERKPMELLILLVSRQSQLVTRAEIAQHLWSSQVFVDTRHGINTAILGNQEKALSFLEESLRKHAPEIAFIQSDPEFDFLHSEPRFRAIIKGMGLPPAT
jgi:two-component SAPR family response regulator